MLNAVVRACHVQGCLRPQATRISITYASFRMRSLKDPRSGGGAAAPVRSHYYMT